MEKLEIQHVTKTYADRVILQDITFDLKKGSFVVIAGSSGCGKSTLLKMIAGFIDMDAGDILKDGVSIQHLDPAQRKVSMVFQEPALFEHMSVYDNITYGLTYGGMSKEECIQKANMYMDVLHIKSLAKQKVKYLSGGEKQRVSIARALVRDSDLFLLDEPFSALDVRLKSECILEVKKLYQDMKKTFLYVTHDQHEAMLLATQLIILHKGCIQQSGTPQDIYHNPCNLFVANFIGKYKLNLLEGEFRNHKIFYQGEEVMHGMLSEKDAVCLIGFREHDIVFSQTGVIGVVQSIDDFGDEQYYHVFVPKCNQTFVVKGDRKDIKSLHEQVFISFHWQQGLYFYKDNETRIR